MADHDRPTPIDGMRRVSVRPGDSLAPVAGDKDEASVPSTPSTKAAKAARFGRATIVLAALVATATVGGGGAWLAGRGTESTDDAQVEGHVVSVSARTSGQIARVLVKDNQLVKEGDVLVELDATELAAREDAARADLASAKAAAQAARAQLALTERSISATMKQARGELTHASAGLTGSRATVAQAQADIDMAASRLRLAHVELARAQKLFADAAISRADLDAQQAAFDQATSALTNARARLDSASAGTSGWGGAIEIASGRMAAAGAGPDQLEVGRANVALADAHVQQTEVAVRLAEIARSYAVIRAPLSGVVARRVAEPGQTASPDRPLLAIIPQDDVWIVANFREDQIARMTPGQPVKLRIDAFGRRELTGSVDSIAGASGARFALLPPDNASGNFIKVTQRIPVLVRVDGSREGLRPGMSAYVTVVVDARSPAR